MLSSRGVCSMVMVLLVCASAAPLQQDPRRYLLGLLAPQERQGGLEEGLSPPALDYGKAREEEEEEEGRLEVREMAELLHKVFRIPNQQRLQQYLAGGNFKVNKRTTDQCH